MGWMILWVSTLVRPLLAMFRNRLSALLVFLLVTLSVHAWAAPGVLRVGMSPDYPPLQYVHEGRIVGLEADNATAVGKILDRRIELVSLPFVELVPSLLAGDIDVIMSGMSMTDERMQQVSFARSYLEVGQMVILHRDKLGSHSQPWAIYRPDVRVGVEAGTTGATFAGEQLPDATIKTYADADAAFTALRSDQIDFYLHDAPTSWQLANDSDNADLISLYKPLTEEYLAWAVHPDNAVLLADLNRALTEMRRSGTLQYIINRWIPVQIEVK